MLGPPSPARSQLITVSSKFIDVDVHVVAAAGNGEHDAEKISPQHDDLIKVGALDESDDFPTSWSAMGPEVLFWAPGEKIEAAAIGSKHKYRVASGTRSVLPPLKWGLG